MKTYNDIYVEARKTLKDAGVGQYALEARVLLAFAAGKSQEEFLRDIRLYPAGDYEERARSLLGRRLKGEPTAYITGEWLFYGLPMLVNPNVLIPRADTETVAETAIKYLKGRSGTGARVLDLCCGSGCIGLAIAANVPEARLILVDREARALAVARRNAGINALSRRVSCVLGDALEKPPKALGRYAMIACNPPYIPSAEIEGLDASVKDYEPREALDGGGDGLDFYRSVCSLWKEVLEEGGYMVFECGFGQSVEVVKIGAAAGLAHLETVKDTNGIDRAVVFCRTVE